MWDKQNFQVPLLRGGIGRQLKPFRGGDAACGRHPVGKSTDIRGGEIIPDIGIGRVEVASCCSHLHGLRLVRRCMRTPVQFPPLLTVGRGGHERVVVLQKLPVGDEHLADIEDLLHTAHQAQGGLYIVDAQHTTISQFYRRSFDGVDRHHACRLARPLHLHLGADGKEVAEDVQRGRTEPRRRKSGVARTAVAEAESPARMG